MHVLAASLTRQRCCAGRVLHWQYISALHMDLTLGLEQGTVGLQAGRQCKQVAMQTHHRHRRRQLGAQALMRALRLICLSVSLAALRSTILRGLCKQHIVA